MKFRSMLVAGCAALTICAPRRAEAYGVDVHFNLTYVLCRLAGMEAKNAIWVAAADQSMDDQEHTTAILGDSKWGGPGWWFLHQDLSSHNGRLFHVFSDRDLLVGTDTTPPNGKVAKFSDGGTSARLEISEILHDLWVSIPKRGSSDIERITSDIRLGQFLHARQDFYSHRQFTSDYLDDTHFQPYGPHAGHSVDGDGHCADYVALRPTLAEHMALDTTEQLRLYLMANRVSYKTISSVVIHDLVTDISGLYYMTEDRPKPIEATPTEYMVAPSDQDLINKALGRHLDGRVGQLPVYSFKLPYDSPDTPLQDVVKNVEAMIKE